MASVSVTYTIVNGTSTDAAQVNQNFTDIVNGLSDGSKTLNVASVRGTTILTLGPGGVFAIDSAGTGNFSFTNSGAPTRILASNGSNSASSDAYIGTFVGGSSAGNAYFRCSMNDSVLWSFGLANASGDEWQLCLSSNLNSGQTITATILGSVVLNSAAISTSATDGFLYIASCAGTPTGTPTTKTGRVPLVYDSSNNKFYVYNGSWKAVTLS